MIGFKSLIVGLVLAHVAVADLDLSDNIFIQHMISSRAAPFRAPTYLPPVENLVCHGGDVCVQASECSGGYFSTELAYTKRTCDTNTEVCCTYKPKPTPLTSIPCGAAYDCVAPNQCVNGEISIRGYSQKVADQCFAPEVCCRIPVEATVLKPDGYHVRVPDTPFIQPTPPAYVPPRTPAPTQPAVYLPPAAPTPYVPPRTPAPTPYVPPRTPAPTPYVPPRTPAPTPYVPQTQPPVYLPPVTPAPVRPTPYVPPRTPAPTQPAVYLPPVTPTPYVPPRTAAPTPYVPHTQPPVYLPPATLPPVRPTPYTPPRTQPPVYLPPATPRPTVYVPQPTTPRPTYVVPTHPSRPIISTQAPIYLPPTVHRGEDIKSEPIYKPQPTQKYLPPQRGEQLLSEPILKPVPQSCAAALKCTPIEFCTKEGVISKTTVSLTPNEELFRVPMTDCGDAELGAQGGKCCRDPDYVDPWPTNLLISGQYDPTLFQQN